MFYKVTEWKSYISIIKANTDDLNVLTVFKKLEEYHRHYNGCGSLSKKMVLLQSQYGGIYLIDEKYIESATDYNDKVVKELRNEVELLEDELKNKKIKLQEKIDYLNRIIDSIEDNFYPDDKLNLPQNSKIKLKFKDPYEQSIFTVKRSFKGDGMFDYYKYEVFETDKVFNCSEIDLEETMEINGVD